MTGGAFVRETRARPIARLMLTDFRSIASAELRPEPGLVMLIGPNGGGKTNVLEAISLMAPGKGMRASKLGEITRHGSNSASGWAIAAEIAGPFGAAMVGTGLAHDSLGRDRRVFRLDGEAASASDIAEHVRIVWVTPAMDFLAEETPGTRRRFFDRLVTALAPAHASHLSRYERAQAERGRLLQEGSGAPSWLDGLEEILAKEGVAIAAARRDVLARLREKINRGDTWRAAFPRAELALEGELENVLEDKSLQRTESDFRVALARGRERDAAAGRMLAGPHRSDLKIRYAAKNMAAELCSTGEQKGLVLNIVLAEAALIAEEAGFPPILLLDEVAAHLDTARRHALLAALIGMGTQIFMTGTDESVFADLGTQGQTIEVADGRFKARSRARS